MAKKPKLLILGTLPNRKCRKPGKIIQIKQDRVHDAEEDLKGRKGMR